MSPGEGPVDMLVPPGAGGGGERVARVWEQCTQWLRGPAGHRSLPHSQCHGRLQPHAGPSPWHPASEALKEELVVQDLVPAGSQAPTLHRVYLFTKGFKPS